MTTPLVVNLALAAAGAYIGNRVLKDSPQVGMLGGALAGVIVGTLLIRDISPFAQGQLDERNPAFWQERARPDAYGAPLEYRGSQGLFSAYGAPREYRGSQGLFAAKEYAREDNTLLGRTRMIVVAT